MTNGVTVTSTVKVTVTSYDVIMAHKAPQEAWLPPFRARRISRSMTMTKCMRASAAVFSIRDLVWRVTKTASATFICYQSIESKEMCPVKFRERLCILGERSGKHT